MSDVTFEIVTLDRLAIAPANARFGRPVETADLETSIAGAGRVVTPLSCYREGDQVLVWDGGRRLLACQALLKAKKLPAGLKAGVPCLIYASADLVAVDSLATFVRENMSAADEFAAYKRLSERGLALTEIAAACNVRTPRVQQLLRLIALAPDVMAAFEGGKIPLDVAEAFTLTDDHARQGELLKAFDPKRDNAWGVRSSLRKAAMDANSQCAKFVGRETYEAAGGKFLLDLFSPKSHEDWTDPELADRLAGEKLAAQVAKVEAEGWQWVESSFNKDWAWSKPYDQLDGKKATFTLEQKAGAGAIVFVGFNGQVEVERGLTRKAGVSKSGKVEGPKVDQALYGWTHGGHEKLTDVATAAVQVGLVANPAAAYDAVVVALAWAAFRENGRAGLPEREFDKSYYSNAMALSTPGYSNDLHPSPGFGDEGVAGQPELRATAKAWRARLPLTMAEFCEAIAALTPVEKAELLAVAFAWTVTAVEKRTDGRCPRWEHLGWMGRHAGVAIEKAWRPTAEFLTKGSKEALFSAMYDVGLEPAAYADCKKSLLVAYLTDEIEKKRWVPRLLRDAFVKVPAAKKAKGGKRMFNDALADQIAEVADEAEPAEV